jgi:hypothetical protein
MNLTRVFCGTVLVIAAGVVYILSPLTVWFAAGIVPVVLFGVRGLDAGERRWITRLVVVAIALRVLMIVGLFLITDHSQVPFGSFFGDEDYFIRRSLWLRNVALGIPIHAFDLEYAFEPNGQSGYLYVLALIQALVGPAPYGLHLVGVFFYVLAALVLYRLVRDAFGRVPAAFGLCVLLFLPSLFAFSIAVLKEPPFVLVSASSLIAAVMLVRAPSLRSRAIACASLVALAAIQQSIRPHGAVFSALGVLGGLAIGLVVQRPKVLLASLVAAPILAGAVLRSPDVQLKALVALHGAARQHWGAVVVSRGVSYRLLDDRFYRNLNEISSLEFLETARFVGRALVSYVVVPLPWHVQSRVAVAYVPEQIVWYLIAALAVIGTFSACRRDPIVTGLLVSHALVIGMAAAFTDGNVGTLVRHRSLAIPYLVWLAGVGACEALAWVRRRQLDPPVVRLTPALAHTRSL